MALRNHYRSLISLAALGVLSAGCEDTAGINVGGIECEVKLEHDIGALIINPGDAVQKVEHTFRFENPSSDHDMILEAELKSCGCVEADIQTPRIPPGGQAVVKVGFQPAYAVERRTETLVVKTGLAEPARVALLLHADIFPRIQFNSSEPLRIASRPERSAVESLNVVTHSLLNETDAELSLTADSDWLNILPQDLKQADEAKGVKSRTYAFRLTINEGYLANRSGEAPQATAAITANMEPWTVSRLVTLKNDPYLASQPPRLFLRARAGDLTKTFVVSADREFEILSLGDERRLLSISSQRLSPTTYRISVRLKNEAGRELPPKTTIVMETDHPEQKTMLVPTFLFDLSGRKNEGAGP